MALSGFYSAVVIRKRGHLDPAIHEPHMEVAR
jgi:hypothetical protein